jgi:D-amino-acid dehydrogenase
VRVAVVGAGIVGVTTAFELATAGLEVTVFDRQGSVAAETSFANAGVVAPGYVTPWAAPGMPSKVLRHLFSAHAPVRLGGWNAALQLPWVWRWWRACRPQVHNDNRAAMHRLARFSQSRLAELTAQLGLSFEQQRGYTVLLRTAQDLQLAQNGLRLLQNLGVHHQLLDGAQTRQLEPGLNPATALHAAIHLPQDGLGNCRQFAQLLKTHAQRLGARFCFDAQVRQLQAGAAPSLRLQDGSEHRFDAVVLCAGVQANALLQQVGLRLPLAPVYGYSVTAPLRQLEGGVVVGPQAALMDEKYKVAVSRLGQRVRVAGSAELGGHLRKLHLAPLRTLYRVLDDWFPGAALERQAQHWKGARPMLPDGPPVLGASGAPGVWLNLGHGSSGWALACGSARVLAECVQGRESPLGHAATDLRLSMQRLR